MTAVVGSAAEDTTPSEREAPQRFAWWHPQSADRSRRLTRRMMAQHAKRPAAGRRRRRRARPPIIPPPLPTAVEPSAVFAVIDGVGLALPSPTTPTRPTVRLRDVDSARRAPRSPAVPVSTTSRSPFVSCTIWITPASSACVIVYSKVASTDVALVNFLRAVAHEEESNRRRFRSCPQSWSVLEREFKRCLWSMASTGPSRGQV